MDKNVDFTDVDRLILESYKSVLDGLSEYIGPAYELVLHSLEVLDHAVIKIINGHYSDRHEGAPITDLALDMLAEIKKSGSNHKNLVYFNRSKKGVPIRAATFPITGSGDKIIGLLCMNFYMDIPLNIYLENILETAMNSHAHEIDETFASSTDELILSAVNTARAEIVNNPSISVSRYNREIVEVLNAKHIFDLKDAVVKVAKLLGISKNTVYLHLRNINKTSHCE
ncbi:MAG: hypothetical protein GX834_04285 [Clostridiaceae bacterium]|nr:hypothetical protein [Clostridiaceae bacterium]